jgi:hypothetical protein
VSDERAAFLLLQRPDRVATIGFTVSHGANSERGNIETGMAQFDIGFLWRIEPGRAGEARARRLLNLVIDGLQAQGRHPR